MPAKTAGNAPKISPEPAAGSRLWAKTIGKIIRPATIATIVSEPAMIAALPPICSSFGRKEPYVIIMAAPTPIEKNA
jgi:hypothetical protein